MEERTDWLDRKIEQIEYRIGMIVLGEMKCLLKSLLDNVLRPIAMRYL